MKGGFREWNIRWRGVKVGEICRRTECHHRVLVTRSSPFYGPVKETSWTMVTGKSDTKDRFYVGKKNCVNPPRP